MDPRVKALWVAALRSGKYQQGEGHLRRKKNGLTEGHIAYCCLGVLTDLMIIEVGDETKAKWSPDILQSFEFWSGNPFEQEGQMLPHPVQRWAGLDAVFGAKVLIDGEYASLTYHNDGYDEEAGCLVTKKTFEQIATAIEEQL
jgi:hypothetical protein